MSEPVADVVVPPRVVAAPAPPLKGFLRRLIWWCMLPPVLLAALFGLQRIQATRADSERTATELARQVAAAIDQQLQARIGALTVLAGSPLAGGPAAEPLYQQAQAFRQTYGSEVILADAQGRMQFHTGQPFGSALPPLPRPDGNAAVPTALRTGRPAVGDSFVGPLARERLVAIAVPLRQVGQPALVLLTPVPARQFQAVLDQVLLPTGWSLSLRDGQRVRMASRTAADGGDAADVDDSGRYQARSAVAPWTVALEVSRAQHMAPLQVAALTVVVTMLAATLTGLLGGTLASRRLARAVARLGEAPGADAAPPEIAELAMVRQRLDESAAARSAALGAMRQSEATFQAMFDAMPDAIVLADAERRILMVNPAFEASFGYAAADVVGRSTECLYADAADFGRTGRDRFNAAVGAAGGAYEMRYRRSDGSEFWAETGGVVVRDADGRTVGLLGVHRDISARKRTEAALKEGHERFAAVFRTSPIGIAIGRLDDGRFVDLNPALEALLGYGRDQLIGRTATELQLWDDPAQRAAVMQALAEQGQAPMIEARLRHRDGALIDVSFASCRVEFGGVPHFVGMAFDITPQRAARRALEQQQAQLQALVAQRTADLAAANQVLAQRAEAIADLYDSAPCGYFALDAERRISQANATALAMLGYARDEFIGHRIEEFMTPDSRALHAQRFAQFLATRRARELDYTLVRRDGSLLPVLVDADMLVDVQGRFVSSRATMVDNSERRARERQIAEMQQELARRADEAEAANRSKSAFLANMSHEIRTPMNAIIGLTHLLSREVRDPQQKDRLAKVADAGAHLLRVINDILDLSKIEAGKMVLDEVEFTLDGLMSRAFEMVSTRAREKGLELVLDTGALPDRLRGDPVRLSQVLINLLANAVKFTDHGWVRLRGELVQRDGARVLVRFEVQDTGAGIAAERQAELFQAFEQADRTSTRRQGGTGLGLALARHFARLMGGDAGVASEPGQGSRFWVTVWLGCVEPAEARTSPVTLAGLRALLVDDLPEARAALADRLTMLGLQVAACDGGAAALQRVADEAAAGRRFDALLIDWCMPGMDGVQLLQQLRGRLGSDLPPAILVTAFDDGTMWQQARLARFYAVLVKPVTASALHDTLARLLRGGPSAQPAAAAVPGEAEAQLRRTRAGQRVLLAEDNPINQEVAEELLRAVGLDVECAADGAIAVEMALSRPYDLVLMDLQMPRLDGLAATRALRERGAPGLPIVAMTANAFGEDREACLAAGMNDHVAKPVSPEALYAALQRWLPAGGDTAGVAEVAAPIAATVVAAPVRPPLPQRLAEVPGLDLAQALAHVGGQWSTLARVLHRFVQTYRDGVPALLVSESPQALAHWRAAAHSMRGACATIGATALVPDLAAFEQALSTATAAAPLAAQAAALHAALCRLAGRLEAALDDGAA